MSLGHNPDPDPNLDSDPDPGSHTTPKAVFRSLQHLFINRQSVFLVCFSLPDLADEGPAGKQALEHVTFWMMAIEWYPLPLPSSWNPKQASWPCVTNTYLLRAHHTPRYACGAPVFLVGTHADVVYSKRSPAPDGQ